MYVFGPGVLIGTLNGATNPTPINIGYAQEITFSEKSSNKELFGQNRRALAVGGGTIKSSLKVKAAKFSGVAIATLLTGASPVAGGTFAVIAEAHTLPASAPAETIAPPNSGVFSADLGVIYAATGIPFQRVASGPTKGQYSLVVATGVYTFAAADDSTPVLISYEYTTSSVGQSVPSTNPQLGVTTSFSADIVVVDPTTNLSALLHIYNCVFNSFDMGTKLEDFTMPELNADCYTNAAGNAWQWNIPDTQ